MIVTDLLSAVQYALLEPPDGGVTYPSGLWSASEVNGLLGERQNLFLKRSLLLVGVATIVAPIGQHRFTLPSDWLTTVSLTWHGDDGLVRPLERSDSFEADHGLSTWVNQRGTPLLYMDEETPTLEVQVAPAPIVAGTLELVYVPEMPDYAGGVETLGVPGTFALPVLKYGVLAELLSKDGRGASPERAAYADFRFQLGIDMAEILLKGWV